MSATLYRHVADQISQQIKEQVYKPGEKLPSVRKLAKQRQISISTALMAYQALEDANIIDAKPKSGYYVKHTNEINIDFPEIAERKEAPKAVSTSQLVMDVMRDSSDGRYLSLGAAIPSSEFEIIRQLKKTFASIVRTQPFLGIGYDANRGNETLRRQLARRAVDASVYLSPEDIIVTAGCQGAINICLRALTNPGDIVAVETPCYYGLLQIIESLGLRAIEIPADAKDGMSVDALQLALEQWPIKLILSVPNFSNPLGAMMPEESKSRLVQLLYQYDIPLIEDDIYGDLSYADSRPRAIKSFDPKGHVLLCSSVSKVLEPQLGLGWIMPGKYMEAVEFERFLSSTSHFRLPHLAVAEILSKGAYDRHLRTARTVYLQRRDQLIELIKKHFPEGTKMTVPQGGFVSWVELPNNLNTTRLYHSAREKGIVIAPGELFSSNPEKFQNSIRLTYSEAWTAQRINAVVDLGALAKAQVSEH